MGKNVGNMKPTNTNFCFYMPPGGGSLEAHYFCMICKLYFNNAVANDVNFRNHMLNEHGFTDGG